MLKKSQTEHAYGILCLAEEYLDGYELISKVKFNEFQMFHVKSYLIIHGIELIFKSVLIDGGISESVLRSKKYGHNLVNLAKEANKLFRVNGQHVFDAKENALIRVVNTCYESKDFEYIAQGSKSVIEPSRIYKFATTLFQSTEHYLVNKLLSFK